MVKNTEFLVVGAKGTDANATGVKLILPIIENFTVTAFGVYNDGGADIGNGAILKLQAVDTTANGATYTDLLTATCTAASVRGTNTFRLCDVNCEKDATVLNSTVLTNRIIANGTQKLPSASKQFIALQLNLTTGGAMSATGTFWMRVQKGGSGAGAISGGEVVVTS